MKKIGTFLLTVAVLQLLMLVGLVGYLAATGRLDKAKGTVILDMLKQPGTPDKLRDKVADIFQPEPAATGSAPATNVASRMALSRNAEGALADVATASDRILYAEQATEKERLRLELEAQNLRRQQEVLDKERRSVEEKLAQIQTERKEFEARAAAADAKSRDESFTQSLTLYNELKTKQVKDLFLAMPADVVGTYLKAMEPERASKIIGEFKTTDEQKFITGVLEKIRTAGTPNAVGDSTGPVSPPAGSSPARS